MTVGASTGGVTALATMVAQLPADFPAAVLIVQHLAPTSPGHLADILARAGKLPVTWAEDGDDIDAGRVYVAPPDRHLLVGPDGIQLDPGPREHFARPSINRLFRTAAVRYGSRTIGVLLTGMMEDGVDGMRAIRRCGGITLAQRPEDAQAPDLPLAAIRAGVVDRTVGLHELGVALTTAVAEPAPSRTVPDDLVAEVAMDLSAPPDPRRMRALGQQTTVACPECGGPMWISGDEQVRRFRCFLGHAHGVRDLLARESAAVEQALWVAVRSLHERATTLDVLASDSRRMGNHLAADQFAKRAGETRSQADLAREFLLSLQHAHARTEIADDLNETVAERFSP